MHITPKEFQDYIMADKSYVEAVCQSQGVGLYHVAENTEDFPSKGLMYYFTDKLQGLGGFSIEGIKSSLEEKVEDQEKLTAGD